MKYHAILVRVNLQHHLVVNLQYYLVRVNLQYHLVVNLNRMYRNLNLPNLLQKEDHLKTILITTFCLVKNVL